MLSFSAKRELFFLHFWMPWAAFIRLTNHPLLSFVNSTNQLTSSTTKDVDPTKKKYNKSSTFKTYAMLDTRELKQWRWRRQRKRHKTIGLMSKNNRSARAFYILVHFFAVLCKTTTWNDQILGFLENVVEHTTVNFSFSFLTWTPFLPIWFLDSSPFL